eukprot:UC4_evm1s328
MATVKATERAQRPTTTTAPTVNNDSRSTFSNPCLLLRHRLLPLVACTLALASCPRGALSQMEFYECLSDCENSAGQACEEQSGGGCIDTCHEKHDCSRSNPCPLGTACFSTGIAYEGEGKNEEPSYDKIENAYEEAVSDNPDHDSSNPAHYSVIPPPRTSRPEHIDEADRDLGAEISVPVENLPAKPELSHESAGKLAGGENDEDLNPNTTIQNTSDKAGELAIDNQNQLAAENQGQYLSIACADDGDDEEEFDFDLIALQEEKCKQDFLLDDLEENCRRIRDDIALSKTKKKVQEADTKKFVVALCEANAEIETLTFDKRQISSQWQSSVVALEHRDEAKGAMQEAIKSRAAHLKSRKNKTDGIRQLIGNEQQNDEQLLMRKSRLDKQIFTTQENINNLQSQQTE